MKPQWTEQRLFSQELPTSIHSRTQWCKEVHRTSNAAIHISIQYSSFSHCSTAQAIKTTKEDNFLTLENLGTPVIVDKAMFNPFYLIVVYCLDTFGGLWPTFQIQISLNMQHQYKCDLTFVCRKYPGTAEKEGFGEICSIWAAWFQGQRYGNIHDHHKP